MIDDSSVLVAFRDLSDGFFLPAYKEIPCVAAAGDNGPR